MMAAWALLVIGGILIAFSIVYALTVLLPTVPPWALSGVVGIGVLLIGGGLQFQARQKLEVFRPLQAHTADLANEATQVAGHFDEAITATKDALSRTTASVNEVAQTIKKSTDIHYQVDQHPWAMFAGAACLGYVGGALLNGAGRQSHAPMASHLGHAPSHTTPSNGAITNGNAPLPESPVEEAGLFEKFGDLLAPQATLLREIAVGTIFALARDLARDAVAKPFAQPIEDFFNDATKKFGGRPVPPGQFKAAAVSPSPVTTGH